MIKIDNLVVKDIISFEVTLQTAKEFTELIDKIEELGVYMDFIFHINNSFNKENSVLIHIEKSKSSLEWEEISENKVDYFKSKVVTVNLEYSPELYSIFSTIYINEITKVIYDFYEGAESIYVSFFVNNFLQEKFKDKDEYKIVYKDLLERDIDLESVSLEAFTDKEENNKENFKEKVE